MLSILQAIGFIFFFSLIFSSCVNEEKYVQPERKIKDISLRRYPLPYPPETDAGANAFDNNLLIKERDSLQKKLSKVSDENIEMPEKARHIAHVKKLLEHNTDKLVKIIESTCRGRDDSQEVQLYDGNLGVTNDFVSRVSGSVGQLQWKYSFGNEFSGPNNSEGNVKGIRWCSGTLIGKNLFITAGHCFDRKGNGWQLPSKDGEVIQSKALAKLMKVNFNYEIDKNTRVVRADTVDFPVEELLEYRNGGLDYAIILLGKNRGGQISR